MAVKIRIPTPLRKFTNGLDAVEVSARSVREAMAALEHAHPGIGAKLLDDAGNLRRFVNVYYKDEDIRFLGELDTPIEDGQELTIVPAIAGGA